MESIAPSLAARQIFGIDFGFGEKDDGISAAAQSSGVAPGRILGGSDAIASDVASLSSSTSRGGAFVYSTSSSPSIAPSVTHTTVGTTSSFVSIPTSTIAASSASSRVSSSLTTASVPNAGKEAAQASTEASTSKGPPKTLIVGLAIGFLAFLLLICGLYWYAHRRVKRQQAKRDRMLMGQIGRNRFSFETGLKWGVGDQKGSEAMLDSSGFSSGDQARPAATRAHDRRPRI